MGGRCGIVGVEGFQQQKFKHPLLHCSNVRSVSKRTLTRRTCQPLASPEMKQKQPFDFWSFTAKPSRASSSLINVLDSLRRPRSGLSRDCQSPPSASVKPNARRSVTRQLPPSSNRTLCCTDVIQCEPNTPSVRQLGPRALARRRSDAW